jgi:uncharacterized membrane protein
MNPRTVAVSALLATANVSYAGAAVILTQTVQAKAMPLGNETEMTDEERAILGRWLRDLP